MISKQILALIYFGVGILALVLSFWAIYTAGQNSVWITFQQKDEFGKYYSIMNCRDWKKSLPPGTAGSMIMIFNSVEDRRYVVDCKLSVKQPPCPEGTTPVGVQSGVYCKYQNE